MVSQFRVEYIPSKHNKIANELSRHPNDSSSSNEIDSLNLQQFHMNTTRLVQEEAECSFRLQRLPDVAVEDLEYQLLKKQTLQGFPADKTKLP